MDDGHASFEPPKRTASTPKSSTKQKGTIQCSQNKLVDLLKTFSKEQHDDIEKAGFGGLLKLKNMNIARETCINIARRFDIESEEFDIANSRIKITIEDVEHILGLPSKGDRNPEAHKKNVPHLFDRYKGTETAISLNRLSQNLTNSQLSGDDFIRSTLLYAIGVFLCPTTQPNVKAEYLGLLDNIEAIKSLNWTSLTLNHLISSIKRYRQGLSNLEGNLCLLQVWFWEKLSIHHLNGNIARSSGNKPIIQFWDKTRVLARIQADRSHDFGTGKIVDDIRESTPLKQESRKYGPERSTQRPQNTNYTNPSYDEMLPQLFSLVESLQVEVHTLGNTTMQVREMCESTQQSLCSFINDFRHGTTQKNNRSKKIRTPGVGDKQATASQHTAPKDKSPEKVSQRTAPKDKSPEKVSQHTAPKDKSPEKASRKRKNQNDKTATLLTRHPSKRQQKPVTDDNFVWWTHCKTQNKSMQQHQLEEFRITEEETPTIQYIESAPSNKILVNIEDITSTKQRLQEIKRKSEWLDGDEIAAYIYCLRQHGHLSTRAGGQTYLETPMVGQFLRYIGEALRENRELNFSAWVLNRLKPYMTHDMVFLPVNPDGHWYLAVVNAKLRTIQVLDSLFLNHNNCKALGDTLVGLQRYLDRIPLQDGFKWTDHNVTDWPITEIFTTPMQTDSSSCGLFTLKYMEFWTGTRLSPHFTQIDIDYFRQKLPVLLVDSKLNKVKGGPKFN
ncbi:hypothetical protein ACP4OV_003524 [Aristida adscensionis]